MPVAVMYDGPASRRKLGRSMAVLVYPMIGLQAVERLVVGRAFDDGEVGDDARILQRAGDLAGGGERAAHGQIALAGDEQHAVDREIAR